MDVERVEARVVANSEEEAGEWGHQPRVDVVHEQGEEGAARGLRCSGGDPERFLLPLIVVARHQEERGLELLPGHAGCQQPWLVPGGAGGRGGSRGLLGGHQAEDVVENRQIW